jgi:hypothetical protein
VNFLGHGFDYRATALCFRPSPSTERRFTPDEKTGRSSNFHIIGQHSFARRGGPHDIAGNAVNLRQRVQGYEGHIFHKNPARLAQQLQTLFRVAGGLLGVDEFIELTLIGLLTRHKLNSAMTRPPTPPRPASALVLKNSRRLNPFPFDRINTSFSGNQGFPLRHHGVEHSLSDDS